jgi:hypothetical protein
MTFIFMCVHYPKPECREQLLRGMTEMGELMAQTPGFIEAGPWQELGSERVVGISRWESRETFLAAVPPGFGEPSSNVHEWETQPREPFQIEQALVPASERSGSPEPRTPARESELIGSI